MQSSEESKADGTKIGSTKETLESLIPDALRNNFLTRVIRGALAPLGKLANHVLTSPNPELNNRKPKNQDTN
ncbi:hypothetical protein H6792_03210 [Candidatus Nomurabacteria bacterium]|nr:hypothetical protein [Candidatus Nomurabacteria bacterium]